MAEDLNNGESIVSPAAVCVRVGFPETGGVSNEVTVKVGREAGRGGDGTTDARGRSGGSDGRRGGAC